MFDAAALQQVFSASGAAWTSTAILFLLVVRMWNGAPALLDRWLAWRAAKAAEKAADWARLREEVTRLADAEKTCRRELADVTKRLATLEGYNIGRGQAAQEAQRIVSEERERDAKRRRGPGNGGGTREDEA